jgi:hypothetical protein
VLLFFVENPDDIYPYATFVLPDADCGANKIQITAYQATPEQRRQQIVLNSQDTLPGTSRHISTLVFQEQSTLPLSDACSKSVSQISYVSRTFKNKMIFLQNFRVIQQATHIR